MNPTLRNYLNVSVIEAEERLSQLLFKNPTDIHQYVKNYTMIKITTANRFQCFFKQKYKQTIISLKNNSCNRTCGQVNTVSKDTLFKNWPLYTSKYKYIAGSLDEPLIEIISKEHIKYLFGKKLYYVQFKGEHSFDTQNPCDPSKIKLKRFCSQEIDDSIQYYCSVLENQQFEW
ncbi:Hypothetical_protein [Hexamita inflata]|uniref:Hypothetical_protein n=1 Tax=Hexamita inflata TaxID=28002 RepID=A0AA86QHX9_9EUKA|nr:Hypothetical protein HINF_LOCUS42593 [Hexamita inflata]